MPAHPTPTHPSLVSVASAARPLELRSGGRLASVDLEVMQWGRPSPTRDNAILVCHSFSADAHAAGIDGSASADWRPWRVGQVGWWDALIGPGRVIDTDRFWVICSNVLGGSGGSTGPLSRDPATGLRYGRSFPAIRIPDLVAAQQRLMDQLDIPRWRLVVGGSLGGAQALTWAAAAGERVGSVVAVATAGALSPAGRAHFAAGAGRIADEQATGGDGSRALRGIQAEARWFSGGPATVGEGLDVSRWPLDRFHPHAHRVLSQALLDYDLAQEWGHGDLIAAAERITAPLRLLGYRDDRVFSRTAQTRLASAVRRAGGWAESHELPGSHGHDSFLAEPLALAPWIHAALTEDERDGAVVGASGFAADGVGMRRC